MPGPYGTALLDDFNRANAGTLGANWTADPWNFGLASFAVASNAASSGSGFHSNWWSAASFGADQEIFFTLNSVTLAGGFVRLMARLAGPGTSGVDGYEVTLDGTTAAIQTIVNAADGSQLNGNILCSLTAGHKYALTCIGSTLEFWRDSGSGWVRMHNATDSTYTAGGSIGIYAQNVTSFIIDDFGGGEISSAPAVVGTISQVNASAASGSTSVTVPDNATGVVALWSGWRSGSSGTLSTNTLGGNAFTTRAEKASDIPADAPGCGVATLTSLPAAGSQTFAWAWSDGLARTEGGGIFLIWVRNINTSDIFRDADVDSKAGSNAVSVTIDSLATDLVLSLGQAFGTAFSTADTILLDNIAVNSEHYDIGQYIAGASTTTCGLSAYDYSSVAAISLKMVGGDPPVDTGTILFPRWVM